MAMEVNEAAELVQRVATSPWVDRLARFGYIIRGVLYGLAGVLTLLFAFGVVRHAASRGDAIKALGQQPLGSFLLIAIAVGLVGYSAWGLIRAFLDPLGKGRSVHGLFQRLGYLVSALSYTVLLFLTLQLLFGPERWPLFGSLVPDAPVNQPILSDEAQQVVTHLQSRAQRVEHDDDLEERLEEQQEAEAARRWTALVLQVPLGAWVIMVAGVWMIGAGFGEAFKGVTGAFAKDFDKGAIGPIELRLAMWLGRIGMVARAVVFAMVGLFLLEAGFESNPGEAHGIGGALEELITRKQGPLMLAGVAWGLILFGIFSALHARWMRSTARAPQPPQTRKTRRPAYRLVDPDTRYLGSSQPAA